MPSKQTSAIFVWDFTLNRKDCETDEQLISYLGGVKELLNEHCKSWTFQLEKGSETGRLHFQGRVSFKTKTRNPWCELNGYSFRWSPTCDTNKDSTFYVMKDETRIDGPWTDKDPSQYISSQYRNKLDTLRPFQKTIWDMCQKFDERKINYVYCAEGNKGKSIIAHLCRLHLGGLVMPPINDGDRLMYTAHNMMVAKNKTRKSIPVFFDLPRAMNKERLYGLYSAIEVIKSGYLFDTRNHYKDYDVDSPNVWVFSNDEPDLSCLSKDRWVLWTITEDYQLANFKAVVPTCNNIKLAHIGTIGTTPDDF